MKYKLEEKDVYNNSHFILDAHCMEKDTNSNSKYRLFYRSRKTYIYDSKDEKVYFFKWACFRNFCFDDNREYVYALRENAYRNKKEQRIINCYHVPSGELIKQYEINKNTLKGYRNYIFKYMDLFDNKIVIVFYHQLYDELNSLKFEVLVYDLLTENSFIVPIHNELKFDHSLTCVRKPYFIFNNQLYLDLIDSQNKHAIYQLNDQKELVYKKALNVRLNIFHVCNNSNIIYIYYDEENSLMNIYLYDGSLNYIDAIKIRKYNIDTNFLSLSSAVEIYIDIELKKMYIFLMDKERASMLYVDKLNEKRKLGIEFSKDMIFGGVVNSNKIIVGFQNTNTKSPNYLINSYRLLDLTYILCQNINNIKSKD